MGAWPILSPWRAPTRAVASNDPDLLPFLLRSAPPIPLGGGPKPPPCSRTKKKGNPGRSSFLAERDPTRPPRGVVSDLCKGRNWDRRSGRAHGFLVDFPACGLDDSADHRHLGGCPRHDDADAPVRDLDAHFIGRAQGFRGGSIPKDLN